MDTIDPSILSDAESSKESASLSRFLAYASNPIDNASVTFFRIGFGALFAWWAWDYLAAGRVHSIYIEPRFHFTYPFLDWVRPLSANGMVIVFSSMVVLGILVAAGAWYRWSACALAAMFTYVFLIERTNYQNHYYLMALLAWWFPLLPLARNVSVDAARSKAGFEHSVPQWVLWILRFHIGLPYFFGGIAKLHGDWLAGEPMRQILASQSDLPIVGSWLGNEAILFAFVWGGLLFDLMIVPMLMIRRARTFAFVFCVAFHSINAILFKIHVFPWFMIFATTLFFEPDWPRRLLGGLPIPLPSAYGLRTPGQSFRSRICIATIALYCLFHMTWPLRNLLDREDASWTERGHLFAWRMMLRGKTSGARFYVTDERTGETYHPNLRGWIQAEQANRFARDPEMIYQLACHLAAEHERRTGRKARVQAVVLTSLNGRKPQLMIDPRIDLAKEPKLAFDRPWIMPLNEPLRTMPWRIPLLEWEKHVAVPKMPDINAREPQ